MYVDGYDYNMAVCSACSWKGEWGHHYLNRAYVALSTNVVWEFGHILEYVILTRESEVSPPARVTKIGWGVVFILRRDSKVNPYHNATHIAPNAICFLGTEAYFRINCSYKGERGQPSSKND